MTILEIYALVDVHIGHLRQKLGDKYIETVRGAGYRFEDKEENDV